MKMNWINCKQASQLMSEAMDHPLPLHKTILLKFHLRICKACLVFQKQLQNLQRIFIKKNMQNNTNEILPCYTENLPNDVRKKMKDLLKKKMNDSLDS